jgi:subfamily B ATP-binding cassette protein MsbA
LLNVIKYFIPYLKNYKRQYIFVIFGIVATATATVLTAHIIQPILDDIFIAKDENMLYIVPPFLILIYLMKSTGRYVQAYFTAYIGDSIVTTLRGEMLEKVLKFDLEYINSVRSGELLSRINGDILRVRYIVSEMLPELSREIVTIIGLVGYVVYQNPLLAFYTLVILPATFYPLSLLAKKMKTTSKRSQEKNADLFSRQTEIFNNIEVIKANSTESIELDTFQKENRELFKINMRGTKIFQFVSPMMETYSSFSITMVIIFGGHAVINDQMSVGSFFAFLTAVGLLFDPIKKVSSLFNKMQDGVSATERIIDLLSIKGKIFEGDRDVGDIDRVEFRDVSFSFKDQTVLYNISFSANRGEKIALIGNSGGGKSTVLNLLLRFYERSGGDIWINGESIEHLSFQSLRREIAFVSQRVYIFNDTVLNNVVYGSGKEIDMERVEEALSMAEALEFVEKMESGIHTKLSEFGNNLSGGQRQRIALARAIYKDASLLIFDEATSALDNRVERRILENLEEYLKHKILITVAHRLSTVEDSNMLLLFETGKVVANGSSDELLKTSEEYRRLKGHQG